MVYRLPVFAFLWQFLIGMVCNSYAQCPTAAPCLPGNAPASSLLFGMGIMRVQLAGLDTATNGVADGYKNYSCTQGAVLVRGASYTLAVTTNPNADENVGAWIDFDNNGTFEVVSERIMTSRGRQHTASFTLPATVAVGTVLRLRIAADYVNAPIPGPCTTPQYSQTEDYRVVIASTAPPRPVALFGAVDSVTCTGSISFRDRSRNSPTSWHWHFGDGAVSTLQHPTHTYASPGIYSVRLKVCSPGGCDSLTITNFVTVRADAPRPAACQPATTAYCCNFGLTRVQLGGLDHSPGGGGAGYQDASCRYRAALMVDQPYPFTLTTGLAAAQDVRVYLDANDDGQFDPIGERLYMGLGVQNPVINLQLSPALPGLVYQRPLRLRICADFAGSTATGPCAPPDRGQVVDYSVVVSANTAPPRASFALTYQQLCGPVRVAFTNASTGGGITHFWDFGDGTTFTGSAPPPHTYTTPNTYDVRLVARNATGTDTARRQVVVAGNCPTYCVAGGQGNPMWNQIYFTRVQVGALDNTAPRAAGYGYQNYTDQLVTLQQGQTYPIRSESPRWPFSSGPWVRLTAWIDYNQDGVFTAAERIGPVGGFSPHQTSFTVPWSARPGATRLRVQLMESAQLNDPYNSCASSDQGAFTEDYSALIMPGPRAPLAGFSVDQPVGCTGLVQFRDTSSAAPTSWLWTFGDGSSSTRQHPQHAYAQAGTYAVSLSVTNRYGTSQVSRLAAVTVAQLGQGPRPATCLPPAGPNLASTMGGGNIDLIQIGAWQYANPAPHRFAPYRDETCLASATLPAGVPVAFGVRDLINSARVKVWLDANDDGSFDAVNELLFVTPPGYSGATPLTASLTAPPHSLPNRPLRLRVWWMSDYNTQIVWVNGSPCFRSQQWGQVRDFSVVVTSSLSSAQAPGVVLAPSIWNIYPTRTRGECFFQAPVALTGTLTVWDVLGQRVHTQAIRAAANQPLPLHLPVLPPGLYFVRLGEEGGVRRLVIY